MIHVGQRDWLEAPRLVSQPERIEILSIQGRTVEFEFKTRPSSVLGHNSWSGPDVRVFTLLLEIDEVIEMRRIDPILDEPVERNHLCAARMPEGTPTSRIFRVGGRDVLFDGSDLWDPALSFAPLSRRLEASPMLPGDTIAPGTWN